MSLQERLQMISASGAADQKSRIDAYKGLLSELFTSANVEDVRTFVDHVTGGDVPLVVARQVLQEVANGLTALPADAIKSLGEFALDRTANRASSFEDQTSLIREHMAAVYEAEENWAQAAKLLAGIPMDSGIRMIETAYKVDKYIKIAMLFLQDEESVSAETFINRAALLINEAEEDDEKRKSIPDHLKLQHKVCYARILDSKRKFLEAATRYHQLSQLTTRTFGDMTVSEEDMITSLSMAVTCAVLAPAGPQRSRTLGTLYKDERSHSLPSFGMLEKMFMERLLRRDEVEAFAATLATHQKATLEDGSTVLDRAVTEHNMQAVSKLYANITFDQLGALLGITADKAERVAASMLGEKRLLGTIDQPESRIFFEHSTNGMGAGGGNSSDAAASSSDVVSTGTDSAEALRAFDAQIEHICRSVETISNAIVAKHPEFILADQNV